MVEYVDKKISFYKLVLEQNGKPIDPIVVFSKIKSLNIKKGERYLRIKDGKFYSMMFSDEEKDLHFPMKIIFGLRKKKDLPCLEEGGETEPLDIADKALFEPTHIMLFNNNILGVEFNYQGPKSSGLKTYLLKMAREHVDYVDVIQLVKPDFLDTLHSIGDIKLFNLYVHKNFGELFKQASPSIYHSLKSLNKIGDTQEIGVHLRSSKHIKGYDWKKIFNVFKNEDVSAINKAELKAINTETNKLEPINLLDQYIISHKEVVKQDDKYKRVDSEQMFNAIKSSFLDNQSEIKGIVDKNYQKQKTLEKWKE